MNQEPSKKELQTTLVKLMGTLRINKAKVPLDVLKTKYKTGYDALCNNLSRHASAYAKLLIFTGIRIHKDYLDEGVKHIESIINTSGILKQLSADIFKVQDLSAFESHCKQFSEKLLTELEPFYLKHPGLYITEECLNNPDTPPLLYSQVNGCVLTADGWIPAEIYKEKTTKNTKEQARPA